MDGYARSLSDVRLKYVTVTLDGSIETKPTQVKSPTILGCNLQVPDHGSISTLLLILLYSHTMTKNMSNSTPTPSSGNIRRSVADSKVIPMPPTTGDRMAALTDLGATFQEGHHKVSKVATPTDPEMVPSFVDTHQVEALAKQNNNGSLQDAAMATKVE